MPTKRTTNKLSQLYKTIDQKELSADAKKALADLRLATGNFRKQEGKEADAFMLFYNRLVNKKPTAVKTTKEYKAMLTERRRENGRKAMEARKAKQESRQGKGSERDAARPAKPFGWRLKGKHNYRKPTREDIRTGKAYYEARINRADSKRNKFPMLERGGEIEKQEKLINYKIASVIGIDETFKYLDMDFAVSPLQLIRGAVIRGFISVDEINRDLFDAALSESYYIDEIYKDSGQGIGSSDETAFIANMLRNAGIDVKVINGRWQRMADGGEAKRTFKSGVSKEYYGFFRGYKPESTQYLLANNDLRILVTKYYNSDISDAYDIYDEDYNFRGSADSIKQGESKFKKIKLIKSDFKDIKSFKDLIVHKNIEYADGGFMYEREYLVKFENQDSGDIEEISVMAASEKDAIQSAYDESGLSDNYQFVSVKKYADGGFMEYGGEVDKGGMIYALRNEISGGTIANKSGVDSYDDIAKVRHMAIQYYLDNGDVTYSLGELDRVLAMVGEEMRTKMAKGGVFYTNSHKQGH